MYRGKPVYSLGTLEELSSGKEKAKSAMFREAKKIKLLFLGTGADLVLFLPPSLLSLKMLNLG